MVDCFVICVKVGMLSVENIFSTLFSTLDKLLILCWLVELV